MAQEKEPEAVPVEDDDFVSPDPEDDDEPETEAADDD
jgi:hypothetical protein